MRMRCRMRKWNVRLTNVSTDTTYRVIGRSLVFQNAEGSVTGVVRAKTKEAQGVVGHTPVIAPGEQFLYGSGTTLNTKTGTMVGTFHVIEDGLRSEEFESRPLSERCTFFEHLIRAGKVGANFRAAFPVTRCDANVLSLDLPLLMARNADEDLHRDELREQQARNSLKDMAIKRKTSNRDDVSTALGHHDAGDHALGGTPTSGASTSTSSSHEKKKSASKRRPSPAINSVLAEEQELRTSATRRSSNLGGGDVKGNNDTDVDAGGNHDDRKCPKKDD
ncbi:unnamed protein product [Amoebophrya sp. A25]|nr:unnamed protein product [Amoebophrya sp. A25]|eukprot:GSA25T00018150001.1